MTKPSKPIVVTAPATVVAVPPPPESVPKVGDKNIAPTTTAAEDLTHAGQRQVHIVWEITQALIAIAVTAAVIYAAILGRESLLLGNAFTLIIAIYFVRVNHSAISTAGQKDAQYSGR